MVLAEILDTGLIGEGILLALDSARESGLIDKVIIFYPFINMDTNNDRLE